MLTDMNTKHTGRYKHKSIHTQHAIIADMNTKHTGRYKHRSIHTARNAHRYEHKTHSAVHNHNW